MADLSFFAQASSAAELDFCQLLSCTLVAKMLAGLALRADKGFRKTDDWLPGQVRIGSVNQPFR